MSTMSKTLLAVFVGILVGGAAYVMAAPGDSTSLPSAVPAAATTSTTGTVDLRGPCDEAEHANDPRCAGPQVPEDNANEPNRDNNQVDDDQVAEDDDGPLHDLGDDNPGEDHGNRGPGSQNSGPGNERDRSDDVGFDDHGGHGSDDSGFDDHGGSGHSGSDG